MDLDHHDYAKRRRDRLGDSPRGRGGQQQQGRQRRDPDGGIYISARSRARKAPLPMKLRALPASFWEQPNLNKGPSPGAIFSALPPLCKDECMEAAARGTPRQAAGAAEATSTCSPKVSHSPANTELLFSLFHSVEPKTAVRRRTRGR
ncbi:hypothetical protein ONE63_008217 [Megalurothrips usitatus]|uniref:Uncharacterized protein n=1 Tax=Megalurothrips usitatus TaxID=439358 RepID=A0AAV7XKG8_9NEOP|nr:hypothetical protein ONE63_008217 [Megalurothrips usitatus]